MAAIVRVVYTTADTGLTTPFEQTITTTNLGGATPIAVKAEVNYSNSGTVGAYVDHMVHSQGASDGTNEFCWAASCEDVNSGSTNNNSLGSTDYLGVVVDPTAATAATIDNSFTLKNFTTNGCVITWDSQPARASKLRFTFYVATHAEVGVETLATGDSTGTANTVTLTNSSLHPALGYIWGGKPAMTTGDNTAAGAHIGIGAFISDQAATPAIKQYCSGWAHEDNDSSPYAGVVNWNSEDVTARCFAYPTLPVANGTGSNELECTDTNTGSFELTRRNAVESTTRYVTYLVIDFGGDVGVDLGTTLAGSGSTTLTQTPGWQPQYYEFLGTNVAADDYVRGNLCSSFNTPSCVDEDEASGGVLAWKCDNRQNNATDTHSFQAAADVVHQFGDNDATSWIASHNTFTSTTFTVSVDTAPGGNKLCHWLAVEQEDLGVPLAGTGAAAATGSGTLTADQALAGTGTAASAGSGALTAAQALSGTGTAASAGSATLTASQALEGSGAATSTGSGALTAVQALIGTATAAATGSGVITAEQALSGSGAAAATGSGTLTATQALAGTGTAASAGTATLTAAQALSGTGTSTSAGTGILTSDPALEGAGAAAAAGSATLTAAQALSGTGTAAAAGSGALTATQALSGTGTAVAAGSGVLTAAQALSGTGAAASTGTSTLTATQALSGTATAAATGSATLTAAQALSGTATATSTGSGALTAAQALSGTGTAAATGSGVLVADQTLSGTGTATSAGTGVLSTDTPLVGTGAAAATGSAVLTATQALSGTGTAAAAGSGALTATQALSGTGTAASTGTGDLTVAGGPGVELDAPEAVTASNTFRPTLAIGLQSGFDSIAATALAPTLSINKYLFPGVASVSVNTFSAYMGFLLTNQVGVSATALDPTIQFVWQQLNNFSIRAAALTPIWFVDRDLDAGVPPAITATALDPTLFTAGGDGLSVVTVDVQAVAHAPLIAGPVDVDAGWASVTAVALAPAMRPPDSEYATGAALTSAPRWARSKQG